ncbi:hypothetical protein P43SY_008157 [Pythium insidiosum]|uniref:EF-hand domain-containing protein n=1 Tax=Pythium insidiosum TaxID=114742 RepID=A0AAD5Q5N8_PYTIN|nr:hypothetical protein P43SY_008157 [Pythium insidiosum]
MQSNLAPSVTPRPVRASGQASAGGRAGRTYSPVKAQLTASGGSKSPEATRPAESASTSASATAMGALRFQKKPLIVAGDSRNLDSNFAIAMSKVALPLSEIQGVFQRHGVAVSNDEATTLRHEFEENNDRGLSYDAFVGELVQLLKETAMNKSGTARFATKKTRLAEHCRLLSTLHALVAAELQELLRDQLRVTWATVRDACRRADPAKHGRLPRAAFARVFEQLGVALRPALLDALVLRQRPATHAARGRGAGSSGDSEIDYNEFLAHFGAAFQHGDTNSVSFTLLYGRPPNSVLLEDPESSSELPAASPRRQPNKTLQSPGVSRALSAHDSPSGSPQDPSPQSSSAVVADQLALEKLRITLHDKLAARHADVKQAFVALDQDNSGAISRAEFERLLHDLNLVTTREDRAALLAAVDADGDGRVNYREFLRQFGDALKPGVGVAGGVRPGPLENSSLVFAGHHDVKGANKNRSALSSPGNELKDAFSRLPDDAWRAILVELELSDAKRTGVVPSAELLRVLSKHLGELPRRHFAVLFRACGSHVNELMNYRQLVKSYRAAVLDPVEFFRKDAHANTARTFQRSPTESLVMIWSIRVVRAQMPPADWTALKDALWRADARRQGRLVAAQFKPIVKDRMRLSEDQAAFLCVFYEDRNLTADHVLVRYGSFLTDFEDSGLEALDGDGAKPDGRTSSTMARVERKGRVRAPGYGIHNSQHHPPSAAAGPSAEQLDRDDEEESRLRGFFTAYVRHLESRLGDLDLERRGFVSLEQFTALARELHALSQATNTALSSATFAWRDNSRVLARLLSKYVAQSHFYYRGFLLDFDPRSGLQTQALVVQDDDEGGGPKDEGDGEPEGDADSDGLGALGLGLGAARSLSVAEAREALRHHLTVSRSRQKVVYKLLQRMDAANSGALTYAELRRALERLEIVVDDEVARAWCGPYEDEDESSGQRTGRVRYLVWLHAHGGRDPDKVDGMSDLSSTCSYYSAITISPRAVGPRVQPASRGGSHALAARAVSSAIEKHASTPLSGTVAAAAAAERKLKTQLDALGRNKWRALARTLQHVDSDHRGSVSAAAFQKALGEAGVRLDQEDVLRLQLKYDVDQSGRLHYHELLRQLTSGMSDGHAPSASGDARDTTLPSLGSPSRAVAPSASVPLPLAMAMASPADGTLPESLRQGVKSKWKAMYASFKTLDKANLGRVSAAHFRQLLEWYALAVSDDVLLLVLRRFDHEADGWVDYNKFMRACLA